MIWRFSIQKYPFKNRVLGFVMSRPIFSGAGVILCVFVLFCVLLCLSRLFVFVYYINLF